MNRGWRTVGDYLKYYNIQDVVPFLVAVKNYTLQFKDRGVDMYRDAISLPGFAKHILSKYIGRDEMYFIDNSSLYNRIRYREVGGQSIVFTRRNNDDFLFVKGYDATSLYLHCLGEGQFVGRPVVYTSPGGDVCSIMLRESLDIWSAGWQVRTCKHTTTWWQILAGMRVDWILAREFEGWNVSVVEKGVSVELTKRESAEYREKLVSNDVSLCRCSPVNRILVDAEFRIDGEVYCLDFIF